MAQPHTRRPLPLQRSIAPVLIGLVAALSSGPGWSTAKPDWVRVEMASPNATQQRYIEADTVRQTGPMSIYRRVRELSQVAPGSGAGAAPGPASVVQDSEYDCMSGKVRVLREVGFSRPWGLGEPVSLPEPTTPLGSWRVAGEHPGGAKVLAMVCPGEPGS